MALPITIPSSPVGTGSPLSVDGSNGPQTPSSPSNPPTLALPPPADAASASTTTSSPSNGANSKRKPSRRANTAERRATHNAVERQRRETLNSRFLDLAALLPNLSQIRRPSKSSIVNSSIAHIHASRRHRLMAARELRLIKCEADALRRELNEWRDRSGLPRVEEPVRGEGFQMILSGEVEVLSAGPIEEEDGADYGDDQYGDDDYAGPGMMSSHGNDDGPEDVRAPLAHAAAASLMKSEVSPFAHAVPSGGLHLQTMVPRQGGHSNGTPMIVQSPTSVSFENPAMVSMYEPHHHHAHPPMANAQFPGQFFSAHGGAMAEDTKMWHGPMYQGPALSAGQQQFTPPGTAQGNAAYYMGMQQRQQMLGRGGMDDAAPAAQRRERSGSMASNGSGGGAGYEMPRRMGAGGHFGDGMGMGGMGMNVGMMKGAPISVGGGGNGHGYASMML
ncbi:hypothetical protein POSPLADRAFT_1044957 [Postia placenta MAD-698-R-SB12]|uniref:BHLH domain-containing protein n=1 Tax=Postia placenta MAD-698-R-SB12 TaxID=670580 RepID=A0A1X6NAU5_9APHY|nr:hypothetical protein POSPLADRAFT_1044957 [Postia placenta MAD-698-R-SB12]OSX65632.1 hypothetical protein POSPLADRAFT_1044957 [Postia placenta MAD-698-R-SB12]